MTKNKKRIAWERIWIYKTNLKFYGNVMNVINKIIMKYMMRWRGHIFKVIKDIQLFHRWHRSRKIRLKKNHNKRWKKNCKVRFKEIRNSVTCTRMTLIKPQISISWSLLFCKILMMILEIAKTCGKIKSQRHHITKQLITGHKEPKVWFKWVNYSKITSLPKFFLIEKGPTIQLHLLCFLKPTKVPELAWPALLVSIN